MILGGGAGAIVIAVLVCEALGWPFLAGPMQRWLSSALHRQVLFAKDAESASTIRIGLLGGIRAKADTIYIGSPDWSQQPHMLLARQAQLGLAYTDLWRAYRGGALTIRRLTASSIDAHIERLADGRATWQFGPKPVVDDSPTPARMPVIRDLRVDDGGFTYDDALMAIDLDAKFSLREGTEGAASTPGAASAVPASAIALSTVAASAAGASGPAAATLPVVSGLQLVGTGHYQKNPVRVTARSSGVLPLVGDESARVTLPITVDASVGRARVQFAGTATDVLHFGQMRGRFSVKGPSLAAVGDPLGVTLPTTAAFSIDGLILKEGLLWNAVVERAAIGESRLSGAFTYDAGRKLPLLSGRLSGTKLLLADLGPAVGTQVKTSAPPDAPPSAQNAKRKDGKVLPDRPFDLPALRAMDANVLIDIADLDLGSTILEPLRPLRAHLILAGGVLTIRDIDARTGQGTLGGTVQLDGRESLALWDAKLNWNNVRLESWIKQPRSNNQPPWVTGRLNGLATLAGQGKSTAAILGSLKGGIRMYLLNGSVSHLAIEAAGLDVAQGLGMLIKGDDALPIQCTVADLVADKGVLRPRVLVLDTADSTLWIDGSLSLASEDMDLRVVVTPKDFSPLALRTPIKLRGTFADPKVSVEAKPLVVRVGAAALLALLNPLAAIVPLVDIGNSDEAKAGAAKCAALAQRKAGKPPVAPERAGKVTQRIQARQQGGSR